MFYFCFNGVRVKMMKKEFKVYSPLTNKSVDRFLTKSEESGSDERIMLEGIASTTSRDLHDEIVSSAAIESMAEQAMVLNIHGDHWYDLQDVIGAIKESSVEDKQLHIKFLITKRHTPDIKDLLETGVRLGLSIGGYVTNYDEKNRIINEIELHEISLTAMPANWDTFGTVTTSKGLVESNCLTGACYEIVKNLNGEIMTKKEMNTKEEPQSQEDSGLTKDEVIELINEYMAEKEETIVEEITGKVESQLESMVEAKVQELIDDEDVPPADDGETKAQEDEEEDDASTEEETEEEETKSLSPEMITEVINKGIADALGEDFAEKVASKMFGELGQTRSNEGSKFDEYQKSLNESKEPEEKVTEKSTYSTKETAQILMNKQKAANPITAAVLKNLE